MKIKSKAKIKYFLFQLVVIAFFTGFSYGARSSSSPSIAISEMTVLAPGKMEAGTYAVITHTVTYEADIPDAPASCSDDGSQNYVYYDDASTEITTQPEGAVASVYDSSGNIVFYAETPGTYTISISQNVTAYTNYAGSATDTGETTFSIEVIEASEHSASTVAVDNVIENEDDISSGFSSIYDCEYIHDTDSTTGDYLTTEANLLSTEIDNEIVIGTFDDGTENTSVERVAMSVDGIQYLLPLYRPFETQLENETGVTTRFDDRYESICFYDHDGDGIDEIYLDMSRYYYNGITDDDGPEFEFYVQLEALDDAE